MTLILVWVVVVATPIITAVAHSKVNRDRMLVLVFGLIGLASAIFWEPITQSGWRWGAIAAIILAILAILFLRWGSSMLVTLIAGLLIFGGWSMMANAKPLFPDSQSVTTETST